MSVRRILNVVGLLQIFTGLSMMVAGGVSLFYLDGDTFGIFLAAVLTSIFGFVTFNLTKFKGDLSSREGFAIVTFAWTGAALFGALPYIFTGTAPGIIPAFFESMSGFTTTGATVFTDIETLPHGILFWRSFTHWLGGMGIIVLSLAVLPFLGVGGMQLYKAEVPGPAPDKLRPRMRDTAKSLWWVYLFFSALETVLLLLGGMDLFESLCHTFGTMATGGFSTKNASIAHYDSAYIDTVVIVFMLLAGINFSLHYLLLKGNPRAMWTDPECRFFLGAVVLFTLVSTFSVFGEVYASFWTSLRYAAFQVVSIVTTTGYATADYEQWPALPQCILLFCMFLGGSAGSTGGGMKCMRMMLVIKHGYQELLHLIHPRAVMQIKLGGRYVSDEVMKSIWGFFIIYLGLFILSSFVVAAMGVDVVTSFAAVAATIGNIGPGLGDVGPTDNYAHFPDLVKWLLSFCMLLGRLEIYTVAVLLVPEFWKR